MHALKMIWPTLGDKSPRITCRNGSHTKKGPGRYHVQGTNDEQKKGGK